MIDRLARVERSAGRIVVIAVRIFEARYRALVADTLDDDRRIGMVLLKPGWETGYEGRPPIYPVGCSGVIVHAVRLDDGRYNIELRGLERFRLVGEDHARAYRRDERRGFREQPGAVPRSGTHREAGAAGVQLVRHRAEALVDLLDMKRVNATMPGVFKVAH